MKKQYMNKSYLSPHELSTSEFFGYKKRSKISMRIGLFLIFIFLLYIAGSFSEFRRTQDVTFFIAALIIFVPAIFLASIPVFLYRSARRSQNENFSHWLEYKRRLAGSKFKPGKSGKYTFRTLETNEKVVCNVTSIKPDKALLHGKPIRRHRITVAPLISSNE